MIEIEQVQPHKISVNLNSFSPLSKNIVMIDDKEIMVSEITIKTAINKPTSVTITMPYCEVQALINSRSNIALIPEVDLTLEKVETNKENELVGVFKNPFSQSAQELLNGLSSFEDKIRQKTIPK